MSTLLKGERMFKWKRQSEKSGLVKARDKALFELQGYEATDAQYQKIIVHVKDLTHLIDLEKSERVSPNTIAIVLGNVIITLIVIGYESSNVVTTKVQGFWLKFK
jgi:hypothetical protein